MLGLVTLALVHDVNFLMRLSLDFGVLWRGGVVYERLARGAAFLLSIYGILAFISF